MFKAKIKYLTLIVLILPLYAEVDYSSEIQPIFNASCTSCHGGAGGLNLSSYENVMAGGNSGAAVIPFDHASSLLWLNVNSGFMPPGNNDLTLAQINLIAQNYVANPDYYPPELMDKPSFVESLKRQVPAGRLGTPEEDALFALFLASDESGFFCGQAFPFSGGWAQR